MTLTRHGLDCFILPYPVSFQGWWVSIFFHSCHSMSENFMKKHLFKVHYLEKYTTISYSSVLSFTTDSNLIYLFKLKIKAWNQSRYLLFSFWNNLFLVVIFHILILLCKFVNTWHMGSQQQVYVPITDNLKMLQTYCNIERN